MSTGTHGTKQQGSLSFIQFNNNCIVSFANISNICTIKGSVPKLFLYLADMSAKGGGATPCPLRKCKFFVVYTLINYLSTFIRIFILPANFFIIIRVVDKTIHF